MRKGHHSVAWTRGLEARERERATASGPWLTS